MAPRMLLPMSDTIDHRAQVPANRVSEDPAVRAENVDDSVPRQTVSGGLLLAVVVGTLLFGQFLYKPVHIDDANFLRLAEGVARDFRRPHQVLINWTGTTVPAFEVLSNPPGVAWWLAPVLKQPIVVQHLWMMIWLLPTAWGARELGRHYIHDDGRACAWVLITCPVVVLSAQSFLPDLPMLACTVVGLGGFVSGRGYKEGWALVAGSAALFRYSGVLILPVLVVIAWRESRLRGVLRCWPAIVPLAALAANDLLVYGKWHLPAMFEFQNHGYRKTPDTIVHNLVAAIGMLGGACLLPILVRQRGAGIAAVVGTVIGMNTAAVAQQNLVQGIPTVVFVSAGTAVLFLLIGQRSREWTLSIWAGMGLALMMTSRFAATRYWIPFLPAFVLLGLRCRRDRRTIEMAIAANILLSLGMSIDDFEFAECQRRVAMHVAAHFPRGQFAGHWGWQHYLEANGWTPLQADSIPVGYFAKSAVADSQPTDRSACLVEVATFKLPDRWPGPRTHCRYLGATYHGGGRGMYAPWTLTNEPYDTIVVYRPCGPAPPDHETPDP